ncbi:BTAD domain-containing putative transcriptional regulator [Kribbella sp. NPDC050124]|uniref:AfsR/SARP family transcriptional regulator n=1 Tax=Kribbella sp. NPDC050124 TaxID=3364114 RepID=UPI0037BDEE35
MNRPKPRYRVLGPIAVDDGDRTQVIDAGIRRTLLALLLSRAGSVVSRDILVDAAWQDARPTQGTIRWHMHALRRLLGAGDELTSTADGYVLHIAPDQLDANRFESLLAEGRERADEPERAAAVLSDALGLWRGSAYEGLAEVSSLRDEADRLTEARLLALELRIEADLALGRHPALVPELTVAVAENPLHEGFRAQLMLSLYRGGRTADALATYRSGRELLAEELGLDPGERLRELEHAILVADPALSPGGEIRALRTPAELPPDVVDLAGRSTELERISAVLRSSQRLPIVAVHGQGGVGKSALAIKAGHRVRDEFPDGQLYADLRGATPGAVPLTPLAVLRRFLRSLGVPDDQVPSDIDEAAARFRSLTAGRRLLVLLDDAVDAAQVRRLTPGGGAVLVTSRMPMGSLDGALQWQLDALAEEDALALLDELAGAGRVAAEPEAAAQVVGLCGRLPLAIRIAGARLAARPDWRVADLAGRLAVGERRLDELSDADLSVRASISVGRQSLGSGRTGRLADRIFRMLPLLNLTDLDDYAIGALIDARPGDTQDGLDRLVLARLVEVRASGRYGMHDLVRLYASEVAGGLSTEVRAAAIRRTGHAYLATLRAASSLHATTASRLWLTSGASELTWDPASLADRDAASSWVDAERENLVAVAALQDDPAVVVGFAAAAHSSFASRGWHSEALRLGRLALDAAEEAGEPILVATAAHAWGSAQIAHRPSAAVEPLQTARDQFAVLGDKLREARVCATLSHALVMSGRPRQAEQELTRSAGLNHAIGEPGVEAVDLTNLGIVLHHQGRLAEARARHHEALKLRQQLGHVTGQGISMANLGQIALDAGEPRQAAQWLTDAIDLLAGWPNELGLGRLLWDLSTAYRLIGLANRALAERERSLEVLAGYDLLTSEQVAALLVEPEPSMPAPYRRFA